MDRCRASAVLHSELQCAITAETPSVYEIISPTITLAQASTFTVCNRAVYDRQILRSHAWRQCAGGYASWPPRAQAPMFTLRAATEYTA